jgi:hypothetical protein
MSITHTDFLKKSNKKGGFSPLFLSFLVNYSTISSSKNKLEFGGTAAPLPALP